MKTKLFYLIAAVLMAQAHTAMGAVEYNVPYIDANGAVQYAEEVTVLTSMGRELTAGWYLMRGIVSVQGDFSNRNTAKGVEDPVHIILEDNCVWTMPGVFDVHNQNALIFYGQSTGANMGKLRANRISMRYQSTQSVIFNGGDITLTTADGVPAVGRVCYNRWGSGGSIIINGGKLTATALSGNTSAIGSGPNERVSTIIINGGTVTATGSGTGQDIGNGGTTCGGSDCNTRAYNCTVNSITINGGSVNATRNMIMPEPRNSASALVYRTTLSLNSVSGDPAVGVAQIDGYAYGFRDLWATNGNKLYFYLPERTYGSVVTEGAGGANAACNVTVQNISNNSVTLPVADGACGFFTAPLVVKKNGIAWTSWYGEGKRLTLRDAANNAVAAYDETLYSFAPGTYKLYDGEEYTGIEVATPSTNPVTLEYYTVRYGLAGNYPAGFSMSAVYDGVKPVLSGAAVLVSYTAQGGAPVNMSKPLAITVAGTETPGLTYNRAWTNTSGGAASGQTLSFGSLTGAVSATYAVNIPNYAIELSTGSIQFSPLYKGYTEADLPPIARSVVVTNKGSNPTGNLTVSVNAPNKFTVSHSTLNSIANTFGTFGFTVTPKHGLGEGTHEATVTVYNTGNGLSKTFTVSFKVSGSYLSIRASSALQTIPYGGDASISFAPTVDATYPLGNGHTLSGQLKLKDAGSKTTAGYYAARRYGFDLSDIRVMNGSEDVTNQYDLSMAPDSVAITPHMLTVTGYGVSNKTYDGNNTAVLSGTPAISGMLGSDVVTLAQLAPVFSQTNAGSSISIIFNNYAIYGADASSYSLPTLTATVANIEKRDITLTAAGSTVAPKVYDATPNANVTYLNFDNLISGTMLTAEDDYSITSSVFNSDSAGNNKPVTVVIALKGDAAINYNLVNANNSDVLTGNIVPATLTITPNADQSKTYDGVFAPTPGPSYTATGWQGSDGLLNLLQGALSYDGGENVGQHSIHLGTLQEMSGNYTISFTYGVMYSITKRDVTMNATAVPKVYDGNRSATLQNVTFSNMANDETLTLNDDYTMSSATFNDDLAGSGKTVTATASLVNTTKSNNYRLTNGNFSLSTGVITPRPITITAGTVQDKPYDGTATATVASVTFVDMVAPLTAGVDYTAIGAFAGLDAADSMSVTLTVTLLNSNYTLTNPITTSLVRGSITPVRLYITPDLNQQRYYGDPDQPLTYTSTGWVNGESAATKLSGALSRDAGENVGTYNIRQGGLWVNSNYTIIFTEGRQLTIAKSSLTVSTTNTIVASKTYDGSPAATVQSVVFDGLKRNEQLTHDDDYEVASATFDDKNVGANKPVTMNIRLKNSSIASNYTLINGLGFTGVTADVTKRNLTITEGQVATKLYDGSPAATVTSLKFDGNVESLPAANYTVSANFDDPNADTGKNVTLTVTLQNTASNKADDNYNLTNSYSSDVLKGNINRVPLTIIPDNVTKVYGETDPPLTYAATGWVNGEGDEKLSGGLSRAPGDSVGQYAITMGDLTERDNHNYNISFTPGKRLSITKKSISLSSGAVVASKTFDNTTAADVQTVGFTGLEYSDVLMRNVDYVVYNPQFEDKLAGNDKNVTMTVVLSSSSMANNYTLVGGTGFSLTAAANIYKKNITVAGGTVANRPYNGNDVAAVSNVTFNGNLETLAAETDYTVAASFDSKYAGNGKTVTLNVTLLNTDKANNYNLTGSVTLTGNISALPLTITPHSGQGKTYGDAEPLLTYASSGWIPGEDATLLTGDLGRAPGDSVGAYPITLGSLREMSGYNNYSISFASGRQFTITKKSISVSASTSVANKIYDSYPAATVNTVVFDGLESTDNFVLGRDYTVLNPQFSDENVGANKPVTMTIRLENSSMARNYSLSNGNFTVYADIYKRDISVTGGTVTAKTYDGNASAAVTGLTFGNTVESLFAGTDYTVSAAFDNERAATGKTVTLNVALLSSPTSNNYNLTGSVTLTGTITPRMLNIIPSYGQTKTYGDPEPRLTYTTTGWIPGEDSTWLVGELNRASGESVGSYAIVQGALRERNNNYTYNFMGGRQFTITKKSITVSGSISVESKPYDDNKVANVLSVTFEGLANSESFLRDTDYAVQNPEFENKLAGDNKTVTMTIVLKNTPKANNYNLLTTGLITLPNAANISKKDIAVTGGVTPNRPYNGSAAANVTSVSFGGTVGQNLIKDEDYTIVSANFDSEDAGNGKYVTLNVTLNPASDRAKNYNLTNGNTTNVLTGNITRVPLTITPHSGQGKTYGDPEPELTYTSTGWIPGEDSTLLSGQLYRAQGDSVGRYDITLGSLVEANYKNNYNINFTTNRQFSIAKKIISVSSNTSVESKIYDGSAAASVQNVSFDGLANNESLDPNTDFSVQNPRFLDKKVEDNKTVTMTIVLNNTSKANNYTLTGGAITLTNAANITKRNITVTGGTVATKTYDGEPNATVNGLTFDGLQLETLNKDQDYTVSATFDSKYAAVNKSVTLTVTLLPTDKANNYNLTSSATLQGTITPRRLDITPNSGQTKVYGQPDPPLTYTTVGWVPGEDSTLLSGVLGRAPGDSVGQYLITQGSLAEGNGSSNYTIYFIGSRQFSITKKSITVSGSTSVQSKTYDGGAAATVLSMAFDGLENGETFEPADYTVQNPLFIDKNVGDNKTVTMTVMLNNTSTANNYTLTGGSSVTLTNAASIWQKNITVVAGTVTDKIYDGDDAANVTSITFDGTVGASLIKGTDYTFSGNFSDKYVGTGKSVTLNVTMQNTTAANNYNLNGVATLTGSITPRRLNVVPNSGQGKTYGETDTALTYTTSGWVAGEGETQLAGGLSRAPGDSVGQYAITLGDLAESNNSYTINFTENRKFTIAKKSITVSPAGTYVASKTYDDNNNADVTTVAFDGLEYTDNLMIGEDYFVQSATFDSKNAGNDKNVTMTVVLNNTSTANNYTLNSNGTNVLLPAAANINKKNITVTGGTVAPKVYDGSPAATVTSLYFDGTLEALKPGVDYDIDANFDTKTVGASKPVKLIITMLSATAADNYHLTNATSALTGSITQAPLVVTPDNVSKAYGASDPPLTYTATGWQGADGVSLTGILSRAPGDSVASYPISQGGLTETTGNYSISFVGNKLFTIAKREITVSTTGASVESKIYDGFTAATVHRVAFDGLQNSESLTAGVDYAVQNPQFTDQRAGNNKDVIITVVLNNTSKANSYSLSNATNFTLPAAASISKKEIAVTGGTVTQKVYDGHDTATVTWLTFNGTQESLMPEDYTVQSARFEDKHVGAGKKVILFVALNSTTRADNYILTNATSTDVLTGNITQAPLTITPDDNQTKVYGQTDPLLSYTATGWVGSADGLSLLTGKLSRDAGNNVNSYLITQGDLAERSGNYSIYFTPNRLFTITPKSITVSNSTSVASKIYDGSPDVADSSVSVVFSGLEYGLPLVPGADYTVQNPHFDSKHVGVGKTVTMTVKLLGLAANNYTLTNGEPFAGVMANISKRDLAVIGGTVTSKPYDGNDNATVTRVVFNGAVETLIKETDYTVQSATFNNQNAGDNKPVTLTVTLGGDALANYNLTNAISNNVLTGSITRIPLYIIPDTGQFKTYGEGEPQLTYADSGWIPGENANLLTGALGRSPGENAGQYSITQGDLREANNNNYNISFTANRQFAIRKKNITITAGTSVENKPYDGATAASVRSVAFDGLKSGDVFVLGTHYAVQSAAFIDENAGYTKTVTMTVVLLNDAATNYHLTNSYFDGAKANIDKKSITITGGTVTPKPYDGYTNATVAGLMFNGTMAPLTAGNDYSYTANFTDKTAADTSKPVTLIVTLSPTSNYTLTNPTTTGLLRGYITRVPLYITPHALTKIYGEGEPQLTYADSGWVGAEGASLLSGVLSRNPGENVGSYSIVKNTLAETSGNYTINFTANRQFTIARREITVSTATTVADKIYDNTTTATVSDVVFEGLANNESLTLTSDYIVQTPQFLDKYAGYGKSVKMTVKLLPSGPVAKNYTLTNGDNFSEVTANIEKREISVTNNGTALTRPYNGSNDATALVTTLTFSGTIGVLTKGTDYTVSATFNDQHVGVNKPVTLIVTLQGDADINYSLSNNISANVLTGAITAVPLRITPHAGQGKVYGETDPQLTYTTVGWVPGEDSTLLSGVLGRAAGEDVAQYLINQGTLAEANGNNNYNISFVSGSRFAIAKKEITLSIATTVESKTYDGNNAANVLNVAFDGLEYGEQLRDSVDYTVQSATFNDKHAAIGKPVTMTVVLNNTPKANNYNLTGGLSFGGVTANIYQKDITINGGMVTSRPYNGNPDVTVTSLMFDGTLETLTAQDYVIHSADFLNKNAGVNKPVMLSVTLADNIKANNYRLTNGANSNVLTGAVTSVPLTITLDDNLGKVYGALDPPLTYTTAGWVGGENESMLTGKLDRSPGENVGQYAVTLGTLMEVNGNSNYNISFITGSRRFTIAKKDIAVSTGTAVASKTYDGNAIATVTNVLFDGLEYNQRLVRDTDYIVLNPVFDDKTASANSKTVTMTVRLLGASAVANNYNLTNGEDFDEVTANINKKGITVTGGTVTSRAYNGNAIATVTGVTFSGEVEPLTAGTDYSHSAIFSDNKNAANNKPVTLTVTLANTETANNYYLTANVITGLLSGNISPVSLRITPHALQKTYGEFDPPLTYDSEGWISGENANLLSGNLSRASGDSVGSYAITQGDLREAGNTNNYIINFTPNRQFSIVKKNIIVTNGTTVADKTYNGNDDATVENVMFDSLQYGDYLTLGRDYTVQNPKFNDKHAANNKPVTMNVRLLNSSIANNYTLLNGEGFSEVTASINKKSITVVGGTVTPRAYNGATDATVTAVTFDGTEEQLTKETDYTISAGFGDPNAGDNKPVTLTVTLNPTEKANNYYLPANVSTGVLTGNISRVPLRIVPDNGLTKIYGEFDPPLTYTSTGWIPGENANLLTGDLSRAPGDSVGSYAITQGDLREAGNNNNYIISFTVNKQFSITKREITVTNSTTVASKTYDGTTEATVQSVTFDGLQYGNNLALGVDYTVLDAMFDTKYAGTDKTVTMTVRLQNSSLAKNYTLTGGEGFSGAKASINKKHITATGGLITTKPYDGYTNATVTGLTFDDAVEALIPQVDYTVSASFGDQNVGDNKSVTLNITMLNDNYTTSAIVPNLLKGNITPIRLNITPDLDQNKTYGDTDPTLTYTAEGWVATDGPSLLSGPLSRAAGESVGKYAIVQGALTETSGNYNIYFTTNRQFSITKRVINVIEATVENKIYDGNTTAEVTSVTFDDLQYGDQLTIGDDCTVLNAAFDTKHAGLNKTVTMTVRLLTGSAVANNYTLNNGVGFEETANIDQKSITINGGTVTNRPYDGANTATVTAVTFDGTMEPLTAGTDYTISNAYFNNEDADNNKPVTLTVALVNTAANNYSLTNNVSTGVLKGNISRLRLDIVPNTGQGKTYGAPEPVIDYEDNGWIAGEGRSLLIGELSRTAGEDVGLYVITQGTLAEKSGNYDISFTGSRQFTISKKDIYITDADVSNKTYDGNNTATVRSVAFYGLENSENLTLDNDYVVRSATFADKRADVGKPVSITVLLLNNSAVAKNYNLLYGGVFSALTADITPRPITATGGTVAPKFYDGNTAAEVTGVTFDGVVETLTSSDYSVSAIFNNQNADTGKLVMVTLALNVGSEAANNYLLTNSTVRLKGSISPTPLTITPDIGQHKNYGVTDQWITYKASGWVNNEGSGLLSGMLSRAPGESAGEGYDIMPGNLSAGGNYAIDFKHGVKFYIVGSQDCFRIDSANNVVIHPYPVATINDGVRETCAADITLSADVNPPLTSGGRYVWYKSSIPHETTSSRYVIQRDENPDVETELYCYVQVIDKDGCESAPSDAVKVNIRTLPPKPVVTPPNTVCDGSANVSLTADLQGRSGEYYEYRWFFEKNGTFDTIGVASHEATYRIANVSSADVGQYKVRVSNQWGCTTESDAKKVTVYSLPPNPLITPANTQHICLGDSILLTAHTFNPPDGIRYIWSFDSPSIHFSYDTSSNGQLFANTTGEYSVVSVSKENCRSQGSGTITVEGYHVPDPPDISPHGSLIRECATSTANLTALTPSATSYQWYEQDSVGKFVAIPSEVDSVYRTDKSGTYAARAYVRYNEWKTCYSEISAVRTVELYQLPMPPTITSDKPLQGCVGEVITLTAAHVPGSIPPVAYAWYKNNVQTAASSDSVLRVAQQASVASYRVAAISADGCHSETSSPREITIHARPSVTILDGVRESCGGRVTLTAEVTPQEPGYTYQWYENDTFIPEAFTSPSYVVAPNVDLTQEKTTTYYLYATNKYGCRSDDPSQPVEVNIRALPSQPTLSAPPVCDGDDATLTVTPTGAGDYRWFKRNGNVFDTIGVTIAASHSVPGTQMSDAGMYAVEIINTWGCTSARGEATLAVKNLPEVTIRGTSVCEDWTGVGVDFATPKGGKYTGWGCNADSVFIPQDVKAGSATITYIYTGTNGCTNTDTKTIEIIPLPNTPIVTANGPTSVCEDSISVTLQISGSTADYYTYQWYKDGFLLPGEDMLSYVANKAGDYGVKVCSKGLCWSANPSDPMTVSVLGLPEAPVIATEDPLMCPGGATTLFVASEERGIFQWYKGDSRKMEKLLNEIASTYNATEVGQYAVDFIGENGCRSPMSDAITIGEYILPITPEIVPSQPTLYANLDYKLLVKTPLAGEQYEWYKNDFSIGATGDAFPIYKLNSDDTGRYTVKVIDEHGCHTWSEPYMLAWADASLFIPNIFTPNGDGINDYFQILGLEDYVENSLEIITKLGRVVFSQKNYYNTWSGDGWPNDIYYYTLKLKREDGATTTQRGYIHLKR